MKTYKVTVRDIKKAEALAKYWHKGQVDKAGVDYFKHLEYVSNQVKSKEAKLVGYLHDILEDTKCPESLIEKEFSKRTLRLVKALTKLKGEEYNRYLDRVRKYNIAKEVKLADLSHNSDLSRLPIVTEEDRQRQEKYLKAIEYLSK